MRIANYVDNASNLFILTFITNAGIANIIIVVVFMWVDLFPSKNNTANWMGKIYPNGGCGKRLRWSD